MTGTNCADATAAWDPTALKGQLVTLDAGTGWAWIAKDLGSGKARLSPWADYPDEEDWDAGFVADPGAGAAVHVWTLSRIYALTVDIIGVGGLSWLAYPVMFYDFTIKRGAPDYMMALVGNLGGASIGFVRCSLQGGSPVVAQQGLTGFVNCRVPGGIIAGQYGTGSSALLSAGLVDGLVSVVDSGDASASFDTLFQGAGIKAGPNGSTYLGDAAIYDCPTDSIYVSVGGFATVTGTVWGSGNAGYGIRCNGQLYYSSGKKPTVTGASGNTIVGGTPKAYANIPYFEPTNGAVIAQDPS